MVQFNIKSRQKAKQGNDKKWNPFDFVSALYEGQELTLNAFRSRIFPIKEKQGKRLKILTSKKMFQIALPQKQRSNKLKKKW